MGVYIKLYGVFLGFLLSLGRSNACPSGCICTMVRSKEGDKTPLGKKVDCTGDVPIITRLEAVTDNLPSDTLILDLSDQELTVLHKDAFIHQTALQRLDLTGNQISVIEPGAFNGLSNLDRLTLDENKLGSVNGSMFRGLSKLERLSLASNQIKTLSEDTFAHLPSLKRLDFESEYLLCDCHLQWIVTWAKEKHIRITSNTECSVPHGMKGKKVKALKKRDFHCDCCVIIPKKDCHNYKPWGAISVNAKTTVYNTLQLRGLYIVT